MNNNLEKIFNKINKYYIECYKYNDHISIIYHYHIIKIYAERIIIIYILEEDHEEEVIKPLDVDYINQIIQNERC